MRGLVLVLLVACSFRHGVDPAHDDGRPGDGPRLHDAPPDVRHDAPPDAGADLCSKNVTACTLANGTCMNGVCVITVTSSGGHPQCPALMPCAIECTANGACSNAQVDCMLATSCTIDCVNNDTCMSSTLNCAPGTCTVYCRGNNSCVNGSMSDFGTTTCSVECCGSGTCPGDFTIPLNCTQGTNCP